MRNWFKRLGWFSRKKRTYEDDELSLFFCETLPGEPDPRPGVTDDASVRARGNKGERSTQRH
jgi:hypothetical protein